MEKKTKTHKNEQAKKTQRKLERYVGRRPDESLTIDEQVGGYCLYCTSVYPLMDRYRAISVSQGCSCGRRLHWQCQSEF